MNRDKVDKTDNVPAIVFVLERPVDEIMHCQFQAQEHDCWNEKDVEILFLVQNSKRKDRNRENDAEQAERKPQFQKETVHIVLTRVKTWQTSEDKYGLEEEHTAPAERLH